MLLEVFYSVRLARTRYILLFCLCIVMSMDDTVWVPSVFIKNRERLVEHDAVIARNLGLAHAKTQGLLSGEHFSVNRTFIQAWAGHKSFVRKDGQDGGVGGGTGHADDGAPFEGERRSSDAHTPKTAYDPRLYCKGGDASRLRFMGAPFISVKANSFGLPSAGLHTASHDLPRLHTTSSSRLASTRNGIEPRKTGGKTMKLS
jgi:hypothetical protein